MATTTESTRGTSTWFLRKFANGFKAGLSFGRDDPNSNAQADSTNPIEGDNGTRKITRTSPCTGLQEEVELPISPGRQQIAKSANPQLQSPFFTGLPSEIRILILGEMFRGGGHIPGIHIDQYGKYPCTLNTDQAARRDELLDVLWEEQRLIRKSDVLFAGEQVEELQVAMHWECAQPWVVAGRTGRKPVKWMPFLPVLLTCKRL
jgi:hypothetical protein